MVMTYMKMKICMKKKMNTDDTKDEIKYNDQGVGFKIDKELTKWLVEERATWGRALNPQKGLDKKYVVLNVYVNDEHVQNLLFDTSTQQVIQELGLGWDCWSKLDILRLANEMDEK